EGPGASSLTVARSRASGTPDFGIFYVRDTVSAKLVGLTITGGLTVIGGGGIKNLGTTTATNCTIINNSAISGNGGGIENVGTMTVTNCTITNNSSTFQVGGAIANGNAFIPSTMTVNNCTIAYNSAVGAGIFNFQFGTMTVTSSTIAYNTNGPGGAAAGI